MLRLIGLCVLLCIVMPLWAADAPMTIAEARRSTDDAIQFLVMLNDKTADAYFHTGEWEKAVVALDREVVLQPAGIEAYANAAWLLWSTGKDDAAMEFYQRMIAANPANPEAYFTVGGMFFNRRRYAEALPWLEKAVNLGLTGRERHVYGHCLRLLGRTADALAFWQKVLAEDPKDEVAKREIERLSPKTPADPAPPTQHDAKPQ